MPVWKTLAALPRGLPVVLAVAALTVAVSPAARQGAPSAAGEVHAEASAGAPSARTPGPSTDDQAWRKRWWIDKTARLLRGGDGLGPDDDLAALIDLPKAEIARRFMRDARFGDAILDFNLFFLGFKSDSLRVDGHYDRTVFDFPNAVAAAQAVLSGGDYFKLFDFEGPFFMAPLRVEPLEDKPQPDDAGLSPAQLRKKAMSEVEVAVARVHEFAVAKPVRSLAEICDRAEVLAASEPQLTLRLNRAFDDAEIFALVRGEVLAGPLEGLAKATGKECRVGSPGSRKGLVEGLQTALLQIRRAFEQIAAFEPAVYQPKSVREFKPFDLSAFPTRQKWLSFGFEQGMALGNSSTNFNRKRSAYVLKRFFCDDLIPIGFESPQEHTIGAHGSQTTCFACHHKLDPMAGFFRSYGAYFFDYGRAPDIIFDDLASKNRRLYEAVWKAASKAQRPWNVGYIRSSRWEKHNDYGSSMADLSRIVRSAPEVKRCLMKRLHEYIVAEDQAVDSGYLDHLTRVFTAEAATNASAALENAIVRILQSDVFEQVDADPKRCYDLAPGAAAGPGPPCRVASILSRNCGQCHNAGGEDGAERFDAGSWILAPDGRNRTFRHVDAGSLQLTAQESLARIIERLSTYDLKSRMPKGRVMPNNERQELFLWAQQEMAATSKRVDK